MCGVSWVSKDHPNFPILFIGKGRDDFFAISERLYFGYAHDVFKRYLEHDVTLDELRRTYDISVGSIDSLHDTVMSADLREASDERLAEWVGQSGALLTELIDRTIYIETLDIPIVLSVLGTEKEQWLENIWEQATHPAFLSFEGRRLQDILSVLLPLQSQDIPLSNIRTLKYIYTDYFSAPTDAVVLQTLEDEYLGHHLEHKRTELRMLLESVASRTTEHDVWLATLKTDERHIVEYVQFVMELRDLRKDPIAKTQAIFSEVATELFTRVGLPVDMIHAVSPTECARGVQYLRDHHDEILARKDGLIALYDNHGTCEVELGDFDTLLKECNDTVLIKEAASDSVQGQVASRGIVQGIVKVIMDPTKENDFAQGDILVTSMTRPEFVPLMKKAGAVVTNEGGITCHAAIISRELKIPCIIGTKIATQVLHDGDLVEVDADNGVVRVIDRTQ
jgi:phosphohistidine swiveling domain-containing protein